MPSTQTSESVGSIPVPGPDGKLYNFPSGTTKEQATQYFRVKGIGKPAGMAAPKATPQAAPQSTPAATGGGILPNLAIGMGKGAASTAEGAMELGAAGANKLLGTPALKGPVIPEKYTSPTGTAQKIGFGTEQIGEFLIPGFGEEELALKFGKAAPLAKAVVGSVKDGILEKTHGGSFTSGALTSGAARGVMGAVQAKAAPWVLSKVFGVSQMRPGEMSAGEAVSKLSMPHLTTGGVMKNARAAYKEVSDSLNQFLKTPGVSSKNVDIMPTIQWLKNSLTSAAVKDEPAVRKIISSYSKWLDHVGAGGPQGTKLSLEQAKGIMDSLEKSGMISWGAAKENASQRVSRELYGHLQEEFLKAAPETSGMIGAKNALQDVMQGLTEKGGGRTLKTTLGTASGLAMRGHPVAAGLTAAAGLTKPLAGPAAWSAAQPAVGNLVRSTLLGSQTPSSEQDRRRRRLETFGME